MSKDEARPKCCLCNMPNKQFVDGTGEPAHNPSPFVASEEDSGQQGNRFTNWVRDLGEEVMGFADFLANDLPGMSGNVLGGLNRSSGRSNRNRGSFVPPIFGPRRNNANPANNSGSRNGTERRSNSRTWSSFNWGTNSSSNNGTNMPNYSNTNPYNQLRPGTQIITQHLTNNPHLNGQRGQVLEYNPSTLRYLVQLQTNITDFISGENNAALVSIKPVNLLQTGVWVLIHGLQSQPRLNGKQGVVTAYHRERNRYAIEVRNGVGNPLFGSTGNGREVSLQPVNIRFRNGTCVRLEGLQRAPQWNGKYGHIVGWVEDDSGESGSGRYEVRLSRQYAVRVKMDNVRL